MEDRSEVEVEGEVEVEVDAWKAKVKSGDQKKETRERRAARRVRTRWKYEKTQRTKAGASSRGGWLRTGVLEITYLAKEDRGHRQGLRYLDPVECCVGLGWAAVGEDAGSATWSRRWMEETTGTAYQPRGVIARSLARCFSSPRCGPFVMRTAGSDRFSNFGQRRRRLGETTAWWRDGNFCVCSGSSGNPGMGNLYLGTCLDHATGGCLILLHGLYEGGKS